MRTPSVILAERPKDIQYNYIRLSENTKLFFAGIPTSHQFFPKKFENQYTNFVRYNKIIGSFSKKKQTFVLLLRYTYIPIKCLFPKICGDFA